MPGEIVVNYPPFCAALVSQGRAPIPIIIAKECDQEIEHFD
jgi:hypothetical protein